MADAVPAPVLDARNEDQIAAEAIDRLPTELSDRSDSNPAVVLIEAVAYIFGKGLFQLNSWPRALVQKLLALVGIALIDALPASTTLTFTLSQPQQTDTIIAEASQASTDIGDIVFGTDADLSIPAYTTPTGTLAITAGSTTVAGAGTSFPTGSAWVGWQLQVNPGGTWLTILSVASTTSLTLATTPAASASGAFNVGPITGSVTATATTDGAATNVGAGKLTTLVTSLSGIASVTNASAATGGADQETVAQAIARAPKAFAARDTVVGDEDYAEAARDILGGGSRAKAQAGYNGTVATAGYVTVALLSKTWTTASSVTTAERAAVIRDLAGRQPSGTTTVDVPANVQSYGSAVAAAVYRRAQYDALTTRTACAAAYNSYLDPSSYPWGRTIYGADLADTIEHVDAVDRLVWINSVPAVGTNYQAATVAMTMAASTSVTADAADIANMTAGKTFLVDVPNQQVYLVTAIVGTTLTLDRAWAGTTGSVGAVPFFTSTDTALANWYSLPYCNLSVVTTAPPPSIIVVGAAT